MAFHFLQFSFPEKWCWHFNCYLSRMAVSNEIASSFDTSKNFDYFLPRCQEQAPCNFLVFARSQDVEFVCFICRRISWPSCWKTSCCVGRLHRVDLANGVVCYCFWMAFSASEKDGTFHSKKYSARLDSFWYLSFVGGLHSSDFDSSCQCWSIPIYAFDWPGGPWRRDSHCRTCFCPTFPSRLWPHSATAHVSHLTSCAMSSTVCTDSAPAGVSNAKLILVIGGRASGNPYSMEIVCCCPLTC